MEEEKAAAYYDELTRKGSGAARFKQGLGFTSNDAASSRNSNDVVFEKGSALPSSSSFLSTFVKASSGTSETNEVDKQAQLQSIQQKLKSKSKNNESQRSRIGNESQRTGIDYESQLSRSRDRDKYINSKRRSRSRDKGSRSRENYSKCSHRSRSRSRERDIHRNSKRRSRSRSRERYSRRRSRSRERSSRRRSRSRERSSRRRSRSRSRGDEGRGRRNESSPRGRRGEKSVKDERNERVDYSKLIQGYDQMTPAERVKAKMKLQLTETAKKDPTRGTGSGWERFDFDKDATLDDEEEIEAAEDDSALVKHIGQSFRFSAVEARREDQIKAAHDEAMFGAPTLQLTPDTDEDRDDSPKCTNDSAPDTSLISNQVISMQQVSWRDRVKKM